MEEELVRILFERALKITTAESCTGGLIAATLVNVPGVSGILEKGYNLFRGNEDAYSRR